MLAGGNLNYNFVFFVWSVGRVTLLVGWFTEGQRNEKLHDKLHEKLARAELGGAFQFSGPGLGCRIGVTFGRVMARGYLDLDCAAAR